MKKDDLEKKYSDITDISVNLLSKMLKLIQSGSIKIDVDSTPVVSVAVEQQGKKLCVDFTEPNLLLKVQNKNSESISIFDELKIAKEFAQKLTDYGMTLSVLRNGKEAITLGDEARPTLSRIITRSDDIQIDSVVQSSKLKGEMESNEDEE